MSKPSQISQPHTAARAGASPAVEKEAMGRAEHNGQSGRSTVLTTAGYPEQDRG